MNKRVYIKTIRPGDYFRCDGIATIYRAISVRVGEAGAGTTVAYTIDGTQVYFELRKPSLSMVEVIPYV